MPEVAKNSRPSLEHHFRWLRTGHQALQEMIHAIREARTSVRLEMYIFHDSPVGVEFREALVNACQRGLRVRVLIDALGSITLPESFWATFKTSGGEFRWFNPITLQRIGLRDHRKILVCDDRTAFIGGLNIATEYYGDGVSSGWRDLGMKIEGPMAIELSHAFDDMFQLADFRHKRFVRLRRSSHQKAMWFPGASLFLSSPGRQRNPMKHALQTDFNRAKKIQIICAYFLPTWRLRLALMRVARRGGQVQLILPSKSDVPLMQLAGQSLYRRLLRAGVEIYEYQPQILHAKLIVIDDKIVYAGSANLDIRSLHLNYELLLRMENRRIAREAGEIFARDLRHAKQIELVAWRKARTFWARLKSRFAHFVFGRLDPYLANRQLDRLFRKKRA
jgi:cardiolipin synthase A/B